METKHIRRFRDAMVCNQVVNLCALASRIIDWRGVDIPTTGNPSSDYSSHSRSSYLVSETDGDPPVSQDVV